MNSIAITTQWKMALRITVLHTKKITVVSHAITYTHTHLHTHVQCGFYLREQ